MAIGATRNWGTGLKPKPKPPTRTITPTRLPARPPAKPPVKPGARKPPPKPPAKPSKPLATPLMRQADADTEARFGPEERALQSLLSEAKQSLDAGVSAEGSAARSIIQAADAARPELQKAYGDAGRSHQEANQAVRADLDRLGAAADPYRAGSAREQAGAERRLSDAMASALKQVEDRKAQAAAQSAYASTTLQGRYRGDVQKIQGQRADLTRRKGEYKVAAFGRALQAEAEQQNKTKDRAAKLEAEKIKAANRLAAERLKQQGQTARNTADNAARASGGGGSSGGSSGGGGGGGGGSKPQVTPNQQRTLVNKVNGGVAAVRSGVAASRGRRINPAAMRTALMNGKNPAGLRLGYREASLAVMIGYYGGVSSGTLSSLRRDGFSPPSGWLRGRKPAG